MSLRNRDNEMQDLQQAASLAICRSYTGLQILGCGLLPPTARAAQCILHSGFIQDAD